MNRELDYDNARKLIQAGADIYEDFVQPLYNPELNLFPYIERPNAY